MQTYYSDLLVIGAGLAGERVACEAAQNGFKATCLSIVPARRSHSSAAQGGMQAALGNCAKGEGDGPDVHFIDTVKGSDLGLRPGGRPPLRRRRAHRDAPPGGLGRALEPRGPRPVLLLQGRREIREIREKRKTRG